MAIQNKLTPVQGKNPTGKECRESTRFRVLLNAELVTTTDEQSVRVRDISTGGAMLEGQRPIALDQDVVLRRGRIEIFARICWAQGNHCGIQFDEALSESGMMAFVHEPAKRSSFVPEPFKQTLGSDEAGTSDWAAIDALRSPIGSRLFGQ